MPGLPANFQVVHAGRESTRCIFKHPAGIAAVVWLLLLPLTIPMMLRPLRNSLCSDEDNVVDAFREMVFFTQNLLPFLVLVFCTVGIHARLRRTRVGDRTKLRRAQFLVITVMAVFSICFLPCTISRMVLLVVSRGAEYSQRDKDAALQVYDGLKCLAYLDLLLDPIVYCLSSTKFKTLYVETYLPFLRARVENKQESAAAMENSGAGGGGGRNAGSDGGGGGGVRRASLGQEQELKEHEMTEES